MHPNLMSAASLDEYIHQAIVGKILLQGKIAHRRLAFVTIIDTHKPLTVLPVANLQRQINTPTAAFPMIMQQRCVRLGHAAFTKLLMQSPERAAFF